MSYDTSNIFARILRGEIPNDTVAENAHALAFRDIRPQAPVHVLVIPKGPYIDLADFAANATAVEQAGFLAAVAGIIYSIPGGLLGLRPVAPGDDRFSENRVGLDLLAKALTGEKSPYRHAIAAIRARTA